MNNDNDPTNAPAPATALEWRNWCAQTKAHYAPLQGWPVAEMRNYWKLGLTPRQASNAARSRRKRLD